MLVLLLTVACGERDSGKSESSETCDTGDTGIQVGVIDPECRCEESTVTIGSGVEAYEPVQDGSCLQMVHGPQGGWHLPGALLVGNTRNVVEILAWAEWQDQRITDELSYRVQLVPGELGTCEGSFPNMFLYLTSKYIDDELRPPEIIACEEVTITMCVDDTGGNASCGDLTVIVAPDPDDVTSELVAPCGLCP